MFVRSITIDRRATVLGLTLFITTTTSAQMTTRVSLDSTGAQAMAASSDARVSEDGRFVVFSTLAGLVPLDTNAFSDVYRYDRNTGTVDLVSVGKDFFGQPTAANQASQHPSVTNDGQTVAFDSLASNLIVSAGDTNGLSDIYVREFNGSGGTNHLVSLNFCPLPTNPAIQGNGNSRFPDISAEPAFLGFASVHTIVYESDATNLAADPNIGCANVDTNGVTDIFVSRPGSVGWFPGFFAGAVQPATELVTYSALGGLLGNAPSGGQGVPAASISSDGQFVAFSSSASNLVAGDTNGFTDVFVVDRQGGTIARASVDSAGNQAVGGASTYPAVSGDATRVAFQSTATNLVAGGSSTQHVYAHDFTTGATIRASQSTAGAAGNGVSQRPDISVDGAFLGFDSVATNLVPNDTNGADDVFVHSFSIRSTVRTSLSDQNAQGNGASTDVCLTGTGGEMVFSSLADNLIGNDTNSVSDVFYRGCDSLGSVYCTAQTNSAGCVPWSGFNGSASSSLTNGFQVTTRNLINQSIGQYIYGVNTSASAFPYNGGFICVGTPLWRGPGIATGGSATGVDCTGLADFDFNSITSGSNPASGLPFQPGDTIRAQFWSRDVNSPSGGTNLSDAVHYTICH